MNKSWLGLELDFELITKLYILKITFPTDTSSRLYVYIVGKNQYDLF